MCPHLSMMSNTVAAGSSVLHGTGSSTCKQRCGSRAVVAALLATEARTTDWQCRDMSCRPARDMSDLRDSCLGAMNLICV
eukprot:jgi/Chrzof1/6417/Cz18g09270.t1